MTAATAPETAGKRQGCVGGGEGAAALLAHGQAAVHRQDLAGDPGGFGGQEEGEHGGEVLRLAEPRERGFLQQGLADLGGRAGPDVLGEDDSGGDGVAPDVLLAPGVGGVAGERVQGDLG